MTKVLIIAEIGVNHNGDMVLAKEMIAAAANCNVDVIKFQTAIPELVQIDNAPKARQKHIRMDVLERIACVAGDL